MLSRGREARTGAGSGTLAHKAGRIAVNSIITVTYNQQQRTISFKVNGVACAAMFTDVNISEEFNRGDIVPFVYMGSLGDSVQIVD